MLAAVRLSLWFRDCLGLRVDAIVVLLLDI